MRQRSGQNLVEFIIVFGLVVVAGIFVLTLLGKNINTMFSNSEKTYESYEPFSFRNNQTTTTLSTISDVPVLLNNNSSTDVEPGDLGGSVDIPIETCANGLCSIDYGIFVLDEVPEHFNTIIESTGASGGTDTIADSIDAIVEKIDALLESDPNNIDLQQLKSQAYEMAETGHIVADAQEWFEVAAERLTSNSPIQMPADNKLCQSGSLKNQSGYCDVTVSNSTFLFDGNRNDIDRSLNTWTDKLKQQNQALLNFACSKDDNIKQTADVINLLASQIDEVSNNVKHSADRNKNKVKNYDDLVKRVASKSTDLKSKLIKRAAKYKAKLAEIEK